MLPTRMHHPLPSPSSPGCSLLVMWILDLKICGTLPGALPVVSHLSCSYEFSSSFHLLDEYDNLHMQACIDLQQQQFCHPSKLNASCNAPTTTAMCVDLPMNTQGHYARICQKGGILQLTAFKTHHFVQLFIKVITSSTASFLARDFGGYPPA